MSVLHKLPQSGILHIGRMWCCNMCAAIAVTDARSYKTAANTAYAQRKQPGMGPSIQLDHVLWVVANNRGINCTGTAPRCATRDWHNSSWPECCHC
jgi:hypothetical protein